MDYREPLKKFITILTVLLLLVLFSTVGIHLIEGWPWLEVKIT